MNPDVITQFRPRVTETRHHVAIRTGHPSTYERTAAPVIALFDWAAHPDKPEMPTLVACALDRVGQYVATPGLISRSDALEALDVIRSHFRPSADHAPARGIQRPGGAS